MDMGRPTHSGSWVCMSVSVRGGCHLQTHRPSAATCAYPPCGCAEQAFWVQLVRGLLTHHCSCHFEAWPASQHATAKVCIIDPSYSTDICSFQLNYSVSMCKSSLSLPELLILPPPLTFKSPQQWPLLQRQVMAMATQPTPRWLLLKPQMTMMMTTATTGYSKDQHHHDDRCWR